MRDQLGFEAARPWMLGSGFISLEQGGIVHAYPHARFLSASHIDSNDGVLVVFLHQEPHMEVEDSQRGEMLELPNQHEVEYDVRVVSGDAVIRESDPEIIGTFYLGGRAHVITVKRAK